MALITNSNSPFRVFQSQTPNWRLERPSGPRIRAIFAYSKELRNALHRKIEGAYFFESGVQENNGKFQDLFIRCFAQIRGEKALVEAASNELMYLFEYEPDICIRRESWEDGGDYRIGDMQNVTREVNPELEKKLFEILEKTQGLQKELLALLNSEWKKIRPHVEPNTSHIIYDRELTPWFAETFSWILPKYSDFFKDVLSKLLQIIWIENDTFSTGLYNGAPLGMPKLMANPQGVVIFDECYYAIKATRPDGACGLYALLGEPIDGEYQYPGDVRKLFVDMLIDKAKESEYVLGILEDILVGHLMNSSTDHSSAFIFSCPTGTKLREKYKALRAYFTILLEAEKQNKSGIDTKIKIRFWEDLCKKEFLINELYPHYVDAVRDPDYYFNTHELQLAAILFNKKLIVFNDIQLAIEPVNSHLPGDPIMIHHRGIHFSRCLPFAPEDQEKFEEFHRTPIYERAKKLAENYRQIDAAINQRLKSTLKEEAAYLFWSLGRSILKRDPIYIAGGLAKSAVSLLGARMDPSNQSMFVQLAKTGINTRVSYKMNGGDLREIGKAFFIDALAQHAIPKDLNRRSEATLNFAMPNFRYFVLSLIGKTDKKMQLEYLLSGVWSGIGTILTSKEKDEDAPKTRLWRTLWTGSDVQGLVQEPLVKRILEKYQALQSTTPGREETPEGKQAREEREAKIQEIEDRIRNLEKKLLEFETIIEVENLEPIPQPKVKEKVDLGMRDEKRYHECLRKIDIEEANLKSQNAKNPELKKSYEKIHQKKKDLQDAHNPVSYTKKKIKLPGVIKKCDDAKEKWQKGEKRSTQIENNIAALKLAAAEASLPKETPPSPTIPVVVDVRKDKKNHHPFYFDDYGQKQSLGKYNKEDAEFISGQFSNLIVVRKSSEYECHDALTQARAQGIPPENLPNRPYFDLPTMPGNDTSKNHAIITKTSRNYKDQTKAFVAQVSDIVKQRQLQPINPQGFSKGEIQKLSQAIRPEIKDDPKEHGFWYKAWRAPGKGYNEANDFLHRIGGSTGGAPGGAINILTVSSPELNRARGDPSLFHYDLKTESSGPRPSYQATRHEINVQRSQAETMESSKSETTTDLSFSLPPATPQPFDPNVPITIPNPFCPGLVREIAPSGSMPKEPIPTKTPMYISPSIIPPPMPPQFSNPFIPTEVGGLAPVQMPTLPQPKRPTRTETAIVTSNQPKSFGSIILQAAMNPFDPNGIIELGHRVRVGFFPQEQSQQISTLTGFDPGLQAKYPEAYALATNLDQFGRREVALFRVTMEELSSRNKPRVLKEFSGIAPFLEKATGHSLYTPGIHPETREPVAVRIEKIAVAGVSEARNVLEGYNRERINNPLQSQADLILSLPRTGGRLARDFVKLLNALVRVSHPEYPEVMNMDHNLDALAGFIDGHYVNMIHSFYPTYDPNSASSRLGNFIWEVVPVARAISVSRLAMRSGTVASRLPMYKNIVTAEEVIGKRMAERAAFLERMNNPVYRSGIGSFWHEITPYQPKKLSERAITTIQPRTIRVARGINRSNNHQFITWVENGQTRTSSIAEMSHAGTFHDRGGLSKAGRALEKKGGRVGSVFPKATGNVDEINIQGQKILDEILNHHDKVIIRDIGKNRYGDVFDIKIGSEKGMGVRFKTNGEFVGFLEPTL